MKGQELVTLDRLQPFRVVEVRDNTVEVLVMSTGKSREIKRKTIEAVSRDLVREGKILGTDDIRDRYPTRNRAYVQAILAKLPGVTHMTTPIRLFYRGVPEGVRDLWAELEVDPKRMGALRTAVAAHWDHPRRAESLFRRAAAHARIRELLAEHRLSSLRLGEFNEQVWWIGRVAYGGETYKVGTAGAIRLLSGLSVQQIKGAYESGELKLTGNQTWGGATRVYGSQFKWSDAEKQRVVRERLRFLLYGEGLVEERIEQVVKERLLKYVGEVFGLDMRMESMSEAMV